MTPRESRYYTSGAVPAQCYISTGAEATARQRLLATYPANTALLGEVRSGKTSTLDAILRAAVAEHGNRFDVSRVHLANIIGEFGSDGAGLFRGVAAAIAEGWGHGELYRRRLEDEMPRYRTAAGIQKLLRELGEERHSTRSRFTVVAIDDFDRVSEFQLTANDFELLRALFERVTVYGLVSLLTARRNLQEIEELANGKGSKFFTLYGGGAIRLGTLDEAEARRFLEQPCCEGTTWSEEQVRAIIQIVGRHPAALMLAGEALVGNGLTPIPTDLTADAVLRAPLGPLRRLHDLQRDLYDQWKLRLSEAGPHGGGYWDSLLRLAGCVATLEDETRIGHLAAWGYIESAQLDSSEEQYSLAFRPFSELFDRYLRRNRIPSGPLFDCIGRLERLLREIVGCVALGRDAEGNLDNWLRTQHPQLTNKLDSRRREMPGGLTVPATEGLIDFTYFPEIAELFLDNLLWAKYPEGLRKAGSSREWKTDLQRVGRVRNPVAHYRVLRREVANLVENICELRSVTLTAALDALRGSAD